LTWVPRASKGQVCLSARRARTAACLPRSFWAFASFAGYVAPLVAGDKKDNAARGRGEANSATRGGCGATAQEAGWLFGWLFVFIGAAPGPARVLLIVCVVRVLCAC